MKKTLLASALLLMLSVAASAQESIHVNQVAMYPQQDKIAVIEGDVSGQQVLVRKKGSDTTLDVVKTMKVVESPLSGKKRTVVDFSALKDEGEYQIECNGDVQAFRVQHSALADVAKSALKAFYYQRSGMAIEPEYAGIWSRPSAHPDNVVYVHPSAATKKRPADTVISSPYGWYDAGDYNKYIVNSAYTIAMMLFSYEHNKDYFADFKVNIPESNNSTPDILDEIMYNLKWMLTMQDPADGGVYHKLTTPNFEAFIAPSACKQRRYVVQKSVTATLDFAAVMAMAARIYKGNADYPDFSSRAAKAAEKAYKWAVKNPKTLYFQEEMNRKFAPAVATGTYGDGNAKDEFFWADVELYLLTGKKAYRESMNQYTFTHYSRPTWNMVASLGMYELAANERLQATGYRLKENPQPTTSNLITYCNSIKSKIPNSAFATPSGNAVADFAWGCLSETFCNDAVSLLFAYRLTGDKSYLSAAQANCDYVLGRNALGYCYVTGFGSKSPMHPHHRLSASDGIEAPIPGLLVGGPNPGQQDRGNNVKYNSSFADESYVDILDSYASNEIAINWNGTLLAALAWLDACYSK